MIFTHACALYLFSIARPCYADDRRLCAALCGATCGVNLYYSFEECPAAVLPCKIHRGNVCANASEATLDNHFCMFVGVLFETKGGELKLLTGGCPDHAHGFGTRSAFPHDSNSTSCGGICDAGCASCG